MDSDLIEPTAFLLPDAPAIAGLRFRRFRGEADYEEIWNILNTCAQADKVDRVWTLEDIGRNYANLKNFDPYTDLLFAVIDGNTISFTRTSWEEDLDTNLVFFISGDLLPAYRRKGIGRFLLHWSERRINEILRSGKFERQAFIQAYVEDTKQGKKILLEREGYSPARFIYTMIFSDMENISEIPIPEGLHVRPVLPDQYRSVLMALDEAARDEWGYIPLSEEMIQYWLGDPDFDASLWQVAWDGDEIAGMVLAYVDIHGNQQFNRKRGVTEPIGVRRKWRRRGLARSLLARAIQELKMRGMTEALLHVDTDNPSGALRLYQDVGFRVVNSSILYRKSLHE